MSTDTAPAVRGRGPRRWALRGFFVGLAITVPAVFLALIVPFGETLEPFLVPAATLMSPLSDTMADWPGLVNMTLVAVVNGAVYATVAAVLAVVAGRARRH